MDRLTESVVTIALGIIGLATLALLVSKNANTTGVINAGGNTFSQALGVAISPVTGASNNNGLSGMSAFNLPNFGN